MSLLGGGLGTRTSPSPDSRDSRTCLALKHPRRASVADTLDGYVVCSSGILVACVVSLTSVIYVILWMGWGFLETVHLGLDLITFPLVCVSANVGTRGSRAGAAVCAAVLTTRALGQLWIWYLAFTETRLLHFGSQTGPVSLPVYPPETKVAFGANVLLSFVLLTYYGVWFGTVQDADDPEIEDGLRQARRLHAVRDAKGEGVWSWPADCCLPDKDRRQHDVKF